MSVKSDKNSYESLSISKHSNDFAKKLRIYYTDTNYIDIKLDEFNKGQTYFIKDKKNLLAATEIFSDVSFNKFINNFTDSTYLSFLQEKNFASFGLDPDQTFFEELCIPSFVRDSYLDSMTKDFSTESLLDISDINENQFSDDLLAETTNPTKISIQKKQPFLNKDDNSQTIVNKNFIKKEQSNVIQVKRNDKQERKKANRRKKRIEEADELKKIIIPGDILKISSESIEQNDQTRLCIKQPAELSNEKPLTQKFDPYSLTPDFEGQSFETDFIQWLLDKEIQYKKPFIKIIEKVDAKIERFNKGEAMDDFGQQIDIENMTVFYCDKNSEGELEGYGKYLYKDKAFNYCRIGKFANGKLNGIGIQIPIRPDDQQSVAKDTTIYYKIGTWKNNEFVKGFQWEVMFQYNISTFVIGGIKKNTMHGESLTLRLTHTDNMDCFFNVVLGETLQHLKLYAVECGTFKEGKQNGKGRTISLQLPGTKEFLSVLGEDLFVEYLNFKKKIKGQNPKTGFYKRLHIGEYVNGLPEGHGKVIAGNSEYVGNWQKGKKDGYGVYLHYEGDRYEGEWKQDKYNGFGKLFKLDGGVFEGHFEMNQIQGKGKFISNTNMVYDGDWVLGQKEGYGTETFPNGYKYEGNWKNDLKDGFGTLFNPNEFTYVGEFKEGKQHGKGSQTLENGIEYRGDHVEGVPNGYGVIYSPDGDIYKGYLKQGNLHGDGEVFKAEKNQTFKVLYEDNILIKEEVAD